MALLDPPEQIVYNALSKRDGASSLSRLMPLIDSMTSNRVFSVLTILVMQGVVEAVCCAPTIYILPDLLKE